MTDTIRTFADLQILLADNSTADISAQDVRDLLASVFRPPELAAQYVGDYDAAVSYAPWAAVRAYDAGDWKMYVSLHSGNVGNDPVTDGGTNWLDAVGDGQPGVVYGAADPNTAGAQSSVTEYDLGGPTGGDFDLDLATDIAFDALEGDIQAALDAVYGAGGTVVVGDAPVFTVAIYADPLVLDGTALTGGGATDTTPVLPWVLGGFFAADGTQYVQQAVAGVPPFTSFWYRQPLNAWVMQTVYSNTSSVPVNLYGGTQLTANSVGEGIVQISDSATRGGFGNGDAFASRSAIRDGGVGESSAILTVERTGFGAGGATAETTVTKSGEGAGSASGATAVTNSADGTGSAVGQTTILRSGVGDGSATAGQHSARSGSGAGYATTENDALVSETAVGTAYATTAAANSSDGDGDAIATTTAERSGDGDGIAGASVVVTRSGIGVGSAVALVSASVLDTAVGAAEAGLNATHHTGGGMRVSAQAATGGVALMVEGALPSADPAVTDQVWEFTGTASSLATALLAGAKILMRSA